MQINISKILYCSLLKKVLCIIVAFSMITLSIPFGLKANAEEAQTDANGSVQQVLQENFVQNENAVGQENANKEENQANYNKKQEALAQETDENTDSTLKMQDEVIRVASEANATFRNQTSHLRFSSDDKFVHQKFSGTMLDWVDGTWVETDIDSDSFETDVVLGTQISAKDGKLDIISKDEKGETIKFIYIWPQFEQGYSLDCFTINGEEIGEATITISSEDAQEIKACYNCTIVNISGEMSISKFSYEIETEEGVFTGEDTFFSIPFVWGSKYCVDSNGVINLKSFGFNSNKFIRATFTPIANEQYIFDKLKVNGKEKNPNVEYTVAKTSTSNLDLNESFKLGFDINVFSEDSCSKFEVYDYLTGEAETTTAKWRDSHLDDAQNNLFTINLDDAAFYVDEDSNWLKYSWCANQSFDCLSNYKFTYTQSEAYVPIWQYKKGNDDWATIVPGDMPTKFENASYQFKLSFKEQHIPIKVSCDNDLVHKKFKGYTLQWVDGQWVENDFESAYFEGEVELGTQVYASGNELSMITRDDKGETRKMTCITPANDFDYLIDYYTLNGKKVGHDIITITSTDFKDFKAFYKTTNFNIVGDKNLNTFKYDLDYNGNIYSGEESSFLVPVMWDSVYYIDDNGALHISYLNVEEEFELYYDAELVPVAKDGFVLDTITVNGNALEKGTMYEVKATETGNLNFVANFRSTEKPVPPTPTADYLNTSIVDGPSTKTADFNYIVVVLLAIVAGGPLWYISRKRKA